MAYDVIFSGAPDQEGEIERFFLCSIGSWGQVSRWAASVEGFPALKELVETGEYTGTDALSRELSKAQVEGGVKATLESLAEKLGVGDPEETITVTDEGADDEGSDDEDGDDAEN